MIGCDTSTNNKQNSIEKKDKLNVAVECEFQPVDSSYRSEKCYINCIEKFNALISEGPTFICVTCNRCLYKSNVKRVKENDYSDIFLLVNAGVVSFDNQCYICLTCHKSLKKKTPCHVKQLPTICLEEVPKDKSTLNILKKELICQRLLFKKILTMPKGQFPKLKGATVNVPVDVSETIKNYHVLMV